MKTVIQILVLLISVSALGQDMKISNILKTREARAYQFYEALDYRNAAELFERVYEEQPRRVDLTIKIGECYRMINDYEGAEKWYKKGIDLDANIDPDYILHFAQALTANQKYEEARIWFKKYAELVPEDERAFKKISTLENLHFHFKDSGAIVLQSLNINTELDEYAPAYYHGGIAFLSNRASATKFKNVMNWGDENNFDLFYSNERENGLMGTPEKFHRDVNSKFHEGPLVFIEADGEKDRIIFTQSDLKDKNTTHLALYEAEVNTSNHEFSNIKELNINDPAFSNAQPAISPDREVLIFASNRPGGYGGTDLFISRREDDDWSEPENLGPVINSEGGEYFPFLANKDELVFASNGHGGLGGMDLFMVDLSSQPYEIENLGYPINSSKDDYAYISNSTGTEGYLSSNRKTGTDDDIYNFRVIWTAYELTVTERGSTRLLPDVEVNIISNGVLKEQRYTNSNGYVDLLAIPGEELILEVNVDGFVENSIIVTPGVADGGTIIPIRLELDKVAPIVAPVAEVTPSEIDWKKYFRQEKLVVQVDGKVYEYREIGSRKLLVSGDEKIILEDIDDAGLTFKERAKAAFEASKIVVQNTFDVTTVYFDFDSESVRSQDERMLEGIAELLINNPNVKVELLGYTDSKGSLNYNDLLSFRRAQQVARYLMEHEVLGGRVLGGRLLVNGYGEQGLLNDCVDGVECTEEEHEINRRVEFSILIYPEDSKL